MMIRLMTNLGKSFYHRELREKAKKGDIENLCELCGCIKVEAKALKKP